MSPQVSLKLDLVRWMAALVVAVVHFSYIGTTIVAFDQVEPFSHLGVLIFFVLSGYVIRFVVQGHHPDALDYLQARWARINSVFLPALALTIILDLIGKHLDPDFYARYPQPDFVHILAYLPIFVSFLFENSVRDLRWFTNGPLWSVAYEVWYYIIFGAFYYARGRARIILTALAALLAGPHILLLMPLWIAGCLVFKMRAAIDRIPLVIRAIMCVGSAMATAFCCLPLGHALLEPLRTVGIALTGEGYHAAFLSDYVTGLFVSVFLATFCSSGVAPLPERAGSLIRWGAGFSFSLYAFHLPIVALARSSGVYNLASPWQAALAFIGIVAVCWVLSLMTERRKRAWRAIANRGSMQLTQWLAQLRGLKAETRD